MNHLYTTPLPTQSQPSEQNRLGQQLSTMGILGESANVVDSISTTAPDLSLEGQFRWGERISTMLADELDELADSGLSGLPLFRPSGPFSNEGFYAIEQADVTALHGNRRDAWRYRLSLTKEGTRSSHRHEIATTPTDLPHPFGSSSTVEVGAPSAAEKVQWHDPRTRETTPASSSTQRSAELADVDIYETGDAPYDDPSLVYGLAHSDVGPVDVRVWDSRGNASRTDGDAIRQWQKCFAPGHDFVGEAIIANGLVRLRFDESGQDLDVERWDESSNQWDAQSLGASSWSFHDLDIRSIGFAQVHARVEFSDGSDYHTLNCWLARGYNDALWASEGTIPAGLQDLLDPVANSQENQPGPTKGLVKRSDL